MNVVVGAMAAIFLGVIIGYFVWGIGDIIMEFNKVNNGQSGQSQASGYDLKDAALLNYRGALPTAAASSS